MNRNHLIIPIISVIVLSSCTFTPQPGITKVEIHVTPRDSIAFCEFTSDGWAEGGHTSGGPNPIVHHDRRMLPRNQIEEIWAAAAAVDTQKYALKTSAQRECVDCVELFIYYSEGKVMHLSWRFKERHTDPQVQKLEELLYKYNVGGW